MGIQKIVVEIDAEISRLKQARALLAGIDATEDVKLVRLVASSLPGKSEGRRVMSAAARKKISAAQKARWSKSRSAVKKTAPRDASELTGKNAAKKAKKHTLSAEARARIAQAQKARWAKVKNAAKKATSPKVTKKSAVAAKTGNSKTKATVAAAKLVTPNPATS